MTRGRKRKFAFQLVVMVIAIIGVANIPLLTPRPPAFWVGMVVLTVFALGVFFGIGVSHFFPGDGEEY